MLVCTGTCGHPSTRSAVFGDVVGSPVTRDHFLLCSMYNFIIRFLGNNLAYRTVPGYQQVWITAIRSGWV